MENLLSDAEMEAVIDGDHGNVFAVLGIHRDKGSKNVFIRAFQPHAKSIEVIGRDGVSRGMMNRLDERGFFQINLGAGDNFSYRFKIENDRGEFYEAEDTYRFRPTLGDIDVYLLGEGSHLEMYRKLGAHVCEQDGVKGVSFAVWAPNAKRVSVVGTAAPASCANIRPAACGTFSSPVWARAKFTNTKSKRSRTIFSPNPTRSAFMPKNVRITRRSSMT